MSAALSIVRQADGPMTGFLESLFTSATGLYAQLMPASLSSRPEAAETRSAKSGEDVAAKAIAPGLRDERRAEI